jgi:hypothetical protein
MKIISEHIIDDFVGNYYILQGIEEVTDTKIWNIINKKFHNQYKSINDNLYSFMIDDEVYMVSEDPDDGYRSFMDSIYKIEGYKIKNRIPRTRVVCRSDSNSYNNLIHFNDCITKKDVLIFGTDHSDTYYPYYVWDFMPQNLACNKFFNI